MTKKLIEKINVPQGVLAPDDLTADEKKQLFALMVRKGASTGFAYTRFFKEGFQPWELDGVTKVKIDYLRHLHTVEKVETEVRCAETLETPDGETYKYRHYYQVEDGERSFDITVAGDFWRFLGDVKRKTHFSQWMADRGMRSAMTVAKRFSADDWREYERIGIREIFKAFIDQDDSI